MKEHFERLIEKYSLGKFRQEIEGFLSPCVGFDITPNDAVITTSRIGGNPILPLGFDWPENKGRPLNHLLQINLTDASGFDVTGLLPKKGLLTFFYDLEEQPWGYDPADLQGYRVTFVDLDSRTEEKTAPDSEFNMEPQAIVFRNALSVPTIGSRSYNRLEELTNFTEDEFERYNEFSIELNQIGSTHSKKLWGGHHQLLGHSANVQGDMQLDAQLVTNGLYCGDGTGYNDPRAKVLEHGADEWLLLLQLDSDETSDLEWGDVGKLFFWIKQADLANCQFERVWMDLQCG